MTHAMVISGVHLDAAGRPARYKVENSWGDVPGDRGYFVMSDAWFEQFVYQVVVPKALAPKDLVTVFDKGEAQTLPPWDPMVSPRAVFCVGGARVLTMRVCVAGLVGLSVSANACLDVSGHCLSTCFVFVQCCIVAERGCWDECVGDNGLTILHEAEARRTPNLSRYHNIYGEHAEFMDHRTRRTHRRDPPLALPAAGPVEETQ